MTQGDNPLILALACEPQVRQQRLKRCSLCKEEGHDARTCPDNGGSGRKATDQNGSGVTKRGRKRKVNEPAEILSEQQLPVITISAEIAGSHEFPAFIVKIQLPRPRRRKP